ncbi:E1A-binding protein p400-like isoform X2 [Neopsephotus bourkii]|uniref:E1A-binding protein p400-like isoform X2 n=1 Tax=Neopsephotus bourkii TaxID=309878 RepID=UPI002AA535A5|nr:E1A-binding protein p400-like isoform X2 [Neopsephotus bourkii]
MTSIHGGSFKTASTVRRNEEDSMKLTEHVKNRTQEYLRSGHFISVLHVLTQMLKVCNHPDPLSPWLPSSSCVLDMLEFTIASLLLNALEWNLWKHADQSVFGVIGMEHQTTYKAKILLKLKIPRKLIEEICCSPSSPVKLKPNRQDGSSGCLVLEGEIKRTSCIGFGADDSSA